MALGMETKDKLVCWFVIYKVMTVCYKERRPPSSDSDDDPILEIPKLNKC